VHTVLKPLRIETPAGIRKFVREFSSIGLDVRESVVIHIDSLCVLLQQCHDEIRDV